MSELILYATPTGQLADSCARYFKAATTLGDTTAQSYPPHCTLTGFFHRPSELIPSINAAISVRSLRDIEVIAVAHHDAWLGLELHSPKLFELTQRFIAALPEPTGDEDPLRPKDWLHLSLAYGVDDLAAYAVLADDLIDSSVACEWEIALWERLSAGEWRRY